MQVLTDINDLAGVPGPLHLAIGVFDGLHLGHQAVLRLAGEGAAASGGRVILVTFDPHPVSVLRPDEAPRILTSTRHKLKLAEKMGVNTSVIVRFDRTFSRRSGRNFIESLCGVCLDLRQISVGRGWKFGSRRSGDLDLLLKLGKEFGFTASGASIVEVDGAPVSSTRIRELIRAGNLTGAARLLGRDYTVLGTVVEGERLGRRLGFPTANLQVHNEQLPPGGVWVVSVERGETVLHGVGNLEVRPTVSEEGAQRRLEIHLLDYEGDELYGEDLEVAFLHHLRPERKFNGLEQLTDAIRNDIAVARKILAG